MKVLTKEQAQAWLNRPEQEGIVHIVCNGSSELAMLAFPNGYTTRAWFAVNFVGEIYRKKPWNWPKPDADTPVDAKVWCRDVTSDAWIKKHYHSRSKVWYDSQTSWSSVSNKTTPWAQIVLANPDDIDEMPPQGLEV